MENDGQQRRRSKVEIYFHLVWATKRRLPLLTPDWERLVHRCVTQEAERLGCTVLAIGGMPDHVHLLVRGSSTVSPAKIAKQVKGVSSALLNDVREEYSEPFDWQDGYGCFSISRPHVAGIVMYVKDQKQHHKDNRIWPEWEETNEAE